MSVSPGQGCTWLKTLGLLCVLEPRVNLNEMTDDRKCPREHMSRAISEQVRVPWSESSTSSSLRKLRGSPQAALTTPWPPPLPPGHYCGVHTSCPAHTVMEGPSSQHPFFSFRPPFFFLKKSPCSSFSFITQGVPQDGSDALPKVTHLRSHVPVVGCLLGSGLLWGPSLHSCGRTQ